MRRCRRVRGVTATLTAVLAMTPPTSAVTSRYDLAEKSHIRLNQTRVIDPAGDVNGDGIGDLVIAADCAPGSVFVVFGPIVDDFTVGDPGLPGFRIDNVGGEEAACDLPVQPVGDVNGDGLSDVAVGSEGRSHNGREASGSIYIVFGKATEDPVDLAEFDADTQGSKGFRVDGPAFLTRLGRTFSGAGDVNADGLMDLVVGVHFYGRTYVVFGKAGPESVDLLDFEEATPDERGFAIQTRNNDTNSGYEATGAGDFNGDGYDDVVIGTIGNINRSIGRAYVVPGRASTGPIDARSDPDVTRIKGIHHGDFLGWAVSSAGDVDSDGFDDVLVGATRRIKYCRSGGVPQKHAQPCRGLAFIIKGRTAAADLNLKDRGRGEIKIRGAHRRDLTGISVNPAGDLNADGYDDFLVGSQIEHFGGRRFAGTANLIFGSERTNTIRLAHLGAHGRKIIGADSSDQLGYMVRGGADLDGDSIPDILACGPPVGANACFLISGADLI